MGLHRGVLSSTNCCANEATIWPRQQKANGGKQCNRFRLFPAAKKGLSLGACVDDYVISFKPGLVNRVILLLAASQQAKLRSYWQRCVTSTLFFVCEDKKQQDDKELEKKDHWSMAFIHVRPIYGMHFFSFAALARCAPVLAGLPLLLWSMWCFDPNACDVVLILPIHFSIDLFPGFTTLLNLTPHQTPSNLKCQCTWDLSARTKQYFYMLTQLIIFSN
mgnify:CR=1 FL=1